MQVLAPAKINLSLRILRKRPDGFHEIETLMAPVSLYDKIDIEKQNRWIDVGCTDPTLSTGDDNLVVRAAKLFFERAKIKSGVSIKLEKNIPHGAGLGGGSSDAASTLLALNQLFQTNLPRETLAKIAETIGSDVPFFIFESAAFCTGRGEIVQPTKLKRNLAMVLFKADFAVPTAWAYSRWKNSSLVSKISNKPQHFYDQIFMNDLEQPVFEKFVFLAQVKAWLLKQPEVAVALMSGSGSTIFAVIRPEAEAKTLADRARNELDRRIWTRSCETI